MAKKKEELEEVTETVKETKKTGGFSVKDPQVVRPKELPLIITPDSGEWENDEQAEYARTLNGYAYANPEKWKVKEKELLKTLEEIGKNPQAIVKKRGNVDPNSRLEYGNKNQLGG